MSEATDGCEAVQTFESRNLQIEKSGKSDYLLVKLLNDIDLS
jgi:hypothetical protein